MPDNNTQHHEEQLFNFLKKEYINLSPDTQKGLQASCSQPLDL
jgi:hypothetical protein